MQTLLNPAKQLASEVKTKNGLIKLLLVITATVLAIFFFKIPVWKPARKTFRRARRAYTRYRAYRRKKRK